MIAPCTSADIASVVHESYGTFRIVSRIPSAREDSTDLSTTLRSFLRRKCSVELNETSGIIAGDVSTFDAPLPSGDVRVSSVPVTHEGRSLTLTCIRAETGCEFIPPPAPAQLVLSQLMAKSGSAVCIIDPVNELITSFNRGFADLWRLKVDTQFTWHGLPMSSLRGHARNLSRIGGDVDGFLAQDKLSESVVRVLGLSDSDAIEATFDPVWIDAAKPYRVIARFSRLGLTAAIRRKELSQNFARLTGRQKEVLRHVAVGRTNAEIARQLGIVVKTVEKHRSMAVARLGVGSVPELVRLVDLIE